MVRFFIERLVGSLVGCLVVTLFAGRSIVLKTIDCLQH